jgi:hypothetical protein
LTRYDPRMVRVASQRRVLAALLAAGLFGSMNAPARAAEDAKPTLKTDTAPPDEEDDDDALPVGDQPGSDTTLPEDKRPGMGGGTPVVGGGAVNVTPPAPHLEGEYGGVNPGQAPAKTTKKAKRKKPVVTWVGFQPLEGGSARVFAQMEAVSAGASSFEQRVVGDELIVLIPKVGLNQRNNARPLDTHFFDGRIALVAAKRVAAKGRGRARTPAGVELRIKFKQGQAAQANGKLEQSQDGSTYLFLDFGP